MYGELDLKRTNKAGGMGSARWKSEGQIDKTDHLVMFQQCVGIKSLVAYGAGQTWLE